LNAELIVVDNGSSEVERARLSELPVRFIDAGANLGYAGGINLGIASATDADAYIVMNCDMEVLPGCVEALVRCLRDNASVAGPKFYWDRTRTLQLPPTELHDFGNEFLRRMSSNHGGMWSAIARKQWRQHAYRHWLAQSRIPSFSLSGAMLAISRDAWERVGQFDERFKLYFEETDWLKRAQLQGLTAFYEPRAEVVHFYNRSAMKESRAQQWYCESAALFAQRYYRWCGSRLLAHVPGSREEQPVAWKSVSGGRSSLNEILSATITQACQWLELSPLLSGCPAAAAYVGGAGSWSVSEELWSVFQGPLSVQLIGRRNTELHKFIFEVPESDSSGLNALTSNHGGKAVVHAG
jgi:GT2 family glycosyltransferase